jgi:transcriptional repressor NrdR
LVDSEMAVHCPYCASRETKVVDKRDAEGAIRRRRRCSECAGRFTTYERPELARIVIVKKDGRREGFNRPKLRDGIAKACTKRPVSAEAIERLLEEIEADLRRRDGLEVPAEAVGELVMEKLRALDKVAYIRFASVYRNFADVSSFEEEVRKLLPATSG